MYNEMLATPARALDANGAPLAGARWSFYASGTTTPLPVYDSPALATALPDPLVADAGGQFPPAWFDPALSYRGVCTDATGTVTLHDIDPINPSLWRELGLPGGAGRIGFAQTGSGAIARTVHDKLFENPIDVRDFGTLGTADDAPVFQAAYDAARAQNRPLRLPTGRFRVSGLVFHGPVPVQGAGASNTVFAPTGTGQTVIKVAEIYDPWIDRGEKHLICDFGIDLDNAFDCIGMHTYGLTRSVIERIKIIGDELEPHTDGNTGWRSEGDQYSAFRDIYIETCQRGFVMTNLVPGGGGLNNHFDGLHVAYCLVNMMMFQRGTQPFGLNHFTNLRLQQSYHCGLYMSGTQGNAISGLSPEADTATRETVTFEDLVIKRGLLHADNRSTARLVGFDHANNSALMRIMADNNSSLEFNVSRGAAVQTIADTSSTIRWEGGHGHGSVFRNTRVSIPAANNYRSLVAWHPADTEVNQTFPNECPTPVIVPVSSHAGCTSTLGGDAQVGTVRTVSYLAQAGSNGVNSISLRVGPDSFPANSMVYASLLLHSDRDTELGFSFAQNAVNGTVELKAGQWTRLLAQNFGANARATTFVLWPRAADQPLVRIAQPITCRNLTGQQSRMLSERHMFNPKDPAGAVPRLPSAPTTGTWPAGMTVLNSAPAAGSAPGWVCVTAGTPGIWKAMAPLAA